MDKAVITRLADAVVDHINDGQFSLPVVAERKYRKTTDLPDLKALHCTVITNAASEGEPETRGKFKDQYTIAVVAQQQCRNDADADALTKVMEEIRDRFRTQSNRIEFAARINVSAISWTWDPIFDPTSLEEKSIFASRLFLTFRYLT